MKVCTQNLFSKTLLIVKKIKYTSIQPNTHIKHHLNHPCAFGKNPLMEQQYYLPSPIIVIISVQDF